MRDQKDRVVSFQSLVFVSVLSCVSVLNAVTAIGDEADASHENVPEQPASKPKESVAESDASTDWQQLQAELIEMRKSYSDWGLRRKTLLYPLRRVEDLADGGDGFDWAAETPDYVIQHQFMRSGIKFRTECLAPANHRRIITYDGIIGRMRDSAHVYNGVVPAIAETVEDDASPSFPHLVLTLPYYAPNLGWIYGDESHQPLERTVNLLNECVVDQTDYRGNHCWRLRFRYVIEQEGGTVADCEVLLSQSHSLLPIRQTIDTQELYQRSNQKVIEIETFQQDEKSQVWYPKTVVTSMRDGPYLQVNQVSYDPIDATGDESKYSVAETVAPRHKKPPKAVVLPFASAAILNRLPGPGFHSATVKQAFRFKIAGIGIVGAIALFALISFTLRKTRLGQLLRQFVNNYPYVLPSIGILLTLWVGYLCSYPIGWNVYGLTMMLVGLFGIGWILFSMLLLGEKKVSIRSVLFAATCAAIFFGGYSQGIKRMRMRDQMIQEVRDQGGQVVMGQWRLDEPGLYLPRDMRRFLGEAWSGRATRAAVTNESFTAKNVSGWCLDEVRWLGIASESGNPFEVDYNVLAEIRDTEMLWTLHVEDGFLTDQAFRELSRFGRLVDLHFDCQHRPLPAEIRKLGALERVWLTNAVVNDQLIESLSGIQNLDYVTLITPQFVPCKDPKWDLKLGGVEVKYTNITPHALNTLGNLDTNLVFAHCNLTVPTTANVRLPLTSSMSFRTSDVSDKTLQRLTDSPKLASIDFTGTDVSVSGIEEFSKDRPRVRLRLE